MYRFPLLYAWSLKLWHGKTFEDRYRYVSDWIKRGDRVLEPGCGPGILPEYLTEGVKYSGFDLGPENVEHATKKGLDVWKGNVLMEEDYKAADVVVVVDVLHHVSLEERKKFISLCWKYTKRLFVICEPGYQDGRWPRLSKFVRWLGSFNDRDGINAMSVDHYFSRSQLVTMIEDGFGVIPKTIRRTVRMMGEDVITVFEKK